MFNTLNTPFILVASKNDAPPECQDSPYFPVYQSLSFQQFVSLPNWLNAWERYLGEDWGHINQSQQEKNNRATEIIEANISLKRIEIIGLYLYEGLEFKITTSGTTLQNGIFDGCTCFSLVNPHLDSFLQLEEIKPLML